MLAENCLQSNLDVALFSATNLLQDAVELFLVNISRILDSPLQPNIPFQKYFDEIDKKLSTPLPYQNQLIDLNKMRVNAKHYSIQPPREKCEEMLFIVKNFFNEVSKLIVGEEFYNVSLMVLIENEKVQQYLKNAEEELKGKKYEKCLVECRKVIYELIEYKFDISKILKAKNKNEEILYSGFCNAPLYAKSKEYIEEKVKEPTDYIVYDFSHLEQKLLTFSIPISMYFNVYRLTPFLYKFDDGEWSIKIDNSLLFNQEDTEYVFNAVIEIALHIQEYEKKVKSRKEKYINIQIDLIEGEDIEIYSKADKNSNVIGMVPIEFDEIFCLSFIIGFDKYQYANVGIKYKGEWIIGFINKNYIKLLE